VKPGLSRALALTVIGVCAFAPVWADEDQVQEQQAAPARKPLQDIPLGPFRLDLSGDLRLRDEYQDGFDVRGYRPDVRDNFLLSRIMLNLDLRLDPDRHVYLQFRDAHSFGSGLRREDFKRSNPLDDVTDIRQAYFEWRQVGGAPIDLIRRVRPGRPPVSLDWISAAGAGSGEVRLHGHRHPAVRALRRGPGRRFRPQRRSRTGQKPSVERVSGLGHF